MFINATRPPIWQNEFDQYLYFKNSTSSQNYYVKKTVKAIRPWNFTPEMSLISIGKSAYYQTDFSYKEEPSDYDLRSSVPAESHNDNLNPLPYPPEELWCIALQQEKSSESSNSPEEITFVIVALHQDLYNADIVIHEIASETKNLLENQVLTAVGCTFQ